MAKQTINLGTGELTGDGESIRSAFGKINDNFDELYTKDSNDVVLSAINGHIIPDTDVTYDLGSATNRFRDLYLSGSSIDLGGSVISVVGGELRLGGVKIPTQADVTASIASAVSAPTGDLTGSVFADDSTLLVDGVNGKIVGDIDTSSLTLYGRMTTADLGGGQTTFRTTETNQDGDTVASVWLQSLTASGMQVINDPAGDSNTLYSTVEVEAGSATLTSAVQTLAGDEFGRVLVAPGFIQLRAGTPADGTQVWQLSSDGSIEFPDSTLQSTAWTGNAPGLTYTDLLGNTEIGVTANVFDFGTNTTIDMQDCSVLLGGATVSGLDSLRSEGDITIDINLSDSTLRTWKFTEGGQFDTAGSIILNGQLRFPGVGTISGDDVVPSLDLEVEQYGDITLLSGNYTWKFGGDGTLTVPGDGKIASPATGNLELDVGRENGGAFIVTAWADKSDPGNGWKQILWGYDGDRYEFYVGGDIATQGSIATSNVTANGLIARQGQYLYVTSAHAGGSATNVAFIYDTDNNRPRQTFYGKTEFGNNGNAPIVDFNGTTIQNWTDPNVVNEHGGGAIIVVAGQTATMDDLTVRITENTPGELDVEFNYDPSSGTVAVSANGDVANRFNGTTNFTAGNTTWTTMNILTIVGDKGEFTIVDHSYHKIYRVTTFARALPGGVDAGDAYCVIERLK